jgi:hypothetical protein
VNGVPDTGWRLESPRLLVHPLHAPGEGDARREQEQPAEDAGGAAAGVCEQRVHRVGGVAAQPEAADDGLRDDVAMVGRRECRDQEQERDQRGERLGGDDEGAVDALQGDERAGAAAAERPLQPADDLTETLDRQRPAPPSQDTAVSSGGPVLDRPQARSDHTPASALIRPDAIASTSDWWSRSFWSAYLSANSRMATSKESLPPR